MTEERKNDGACRKLTTVEEFTKAVEDARENVRVFELKQKKEMIEAVRRLAKSRQTELDIYMKKEFEKAKAIAAAATNEDLIEVACNKEFEDEFKQLFFVFYGETRK